MRKSRKRSPFRYPLRYDQTRYLTVINFQVERERALREMGIALKDDGGLLAI